MSAFKIQRANLFILLCLAILGFMPVAAKAATPSAASILEKAAATFTKSSSASASYTVKTGGGTQAGSLSVKGKKLKIVCGPMTTWYDGTTMWNYNKSDNEVTISTPTSQELASINPYSLIASYKTLYTPSLKTSAIAGTYAVVLTPKSGQSPVKRVVLYIRSSTWQPVRMDITDKTGTVSTVVISNVKSGVSLRDNTFVFPASQYKGVQTIDLR